MKGGELKLRKIIKTTSLIFGVLTSCIMGYVTYLDSDIPDNFYIYADEKLNIYEHSEVSVKEPELKKQVRAGNMISSVKSVELKAFGIIPVKTAYLHKTDEKYLVPCGTPFGIKMLTDGVVVVGLSPVETDRGAVSPAQIAGIKEGDIILSLNGEKVSSFNDISKKIDNNKGKEMTVKIKRQDKELTIKLSAVKSISDGIYRCGIWVRDSSAGIGTITFYDPVTGSFGGLGHAVCDADTGEILPLSSGEVVPVTILDITKGTAGYPGELKGTFISNSVVGKLLNNSETGVYGQLKNKPSENEPIPISLKQDVKEGKAYIYTTISGTHPEIYEIEIEKTKLNSKNSTKNMVIEIIDEDLLKATGGIVQGMSGSPIIQDGKLVGAVTHVFVNDPTRGYGIFIENMLKTAQGIEENKLKNAS